MGLFDRRCSLSGLSTGTFFLADADDEEAIYQELRAGMHDGLIVLLEEQDGRYVPLAPPVRGLYDGYGAIDNLGGRPVHKLIEKRLWKLWESQELTAPDRSLLAQHKARRPALEAMLRLFVDVFTNDVALTLRGKVVTSAFVLAPVADAIARALPAAFGEDPYASAFPEHSLARTLWATLGPDDSIQMLASLSRWAAAHGGWRPTTQDDLGQPSADDLESFGREAWDEGDPILRDLLKRYRPAWTEAFAGGGAAGQGAARPYRPADAFTEGELIAHPKFGVGRVSRVLDPKKIEVEFTGAIRTLGQRISP